VPETTITMQDISLIMTLTARSEPTLAYDAVRALASRLFAHQLFTVTRSILETKEVERVYSSDPTAYPVGGRKQKLDTRWGEHVLDRGQILICHGAADIERVFADHALILSLGITGMINVPVLFASRSVATMNMAHAEDRFTEADFPAVTMLAGLLLPLVLAEGTI
jgi:hypothetical protein